MQGHPKKGTEEKDAGFPLTTCGNDKGGPAGITEGPGRQDKGGPVGMTKRGRQV